MKSHATFNYVALNIRIKISTMFNRCLNENSDVRIMLSLNKIIAQYSPSCKSIQQLVVGKEKQEAQLFKETARRFEFCFGNVFGG